MELLHAVNVVLEAVGLYPESRLDPNGSPSENARVQAIIDRESQQIQGESRWAFNEIPMSLSPSVSGTIAAPAHTIWIASEDLSRPVSIRNGLLYNMADNTSTFTSEIRVRVKQLIAFGCLPDPIAQFVAACAAKRFNENRGDRARQSHLYDQYIRALKIANRFNAQSKTQRVGDSIEGLQARGRSTPVRGPVR